MTISRFRGVGLTGFMLMFQACTMAQTSQKSPGPPSNQERALVRRTALAFLNSWLVKQDLEAAKQSFGPAAYQNEEMLQESCAGYITPELKSSEEARRAGIGKFLKDFLPVPPVQRLDQVLNGKTAIEIGGAQLGASLANDPKADGFVLAKLSRDQVPTSSQEAKGYLSRRLPADFYVSFVSIGGGSVYFLWIRDGSAWRIMHASLVCM